jgi:hypothetical protein
MKHLKKSYYCLLVALYVAALPSLAQIENSSIRFSITENGKRISPPGHFTLTVDGKGTDVTVSGGRFRVPSSLVGLEKTKPVTFTTRWRGERIHAELKAGDFRSTLWMVLLNDESVPEEYRDVMPPGANVKDTCIFVFDGGGGDASFLLSPHCREKVKD